MLFYILLSVSFPEDRVDSVERLLPPFGDIVNDTDFLLQ